MRTARVAFLLVLLCAAACARAQSFDTATIRPADPEHRGESWSTSNNRVSYRGVTLRALIKVAFALHADAQVIDGPDWIAGRRFDIAARMDDDEYARVDTMKGVEQEHEYQALLRHLLEERFGLKTQAGTKALPQFALSVDGAAPKLTAALEGTEQNINVHTGHIEAKGVPMDSLVSTLANLPEVGGHVVADRTALTGSYNFTLDWTPERPSGTPADATLPGLFTALREQLGLRLTKGEGDVPVVMVLQASLPQFD